MVLELLGDVPGSASRDFDPCLGEEGTSREHEGDVDEGVDGVEDGLLDGVGWRHVVRDTLGRTELRRVLEGLENKGQKSHLQNIRYTHLPDTENLDKNIAWEAG